MEEFKDVIRIETGENRLSGLLRVQQLGFERFETENGVTIRLGYKDSLGNVHYFTKDDEFVSEYWKSSTNGIFYEDGNVAIGTRPGTSVFEVRRNSPFSTMRQLRTSYSDSHMADIGISGTGAFRIYLHGWQERLCMHTNFFNIRSSNSVIEYNDSINEMYLHTRNSHSRIRLKASNNWWGAGKIILDIGSGGGAVEFHQQGSSFCHLSYSDSSSDKNVLLETCGSDKDFKINSKRNLELSSGLDSRIRSESNSGRIALDVGGGGSVEFFQWGSAFGRIRYIGSNNEALLETTRRNTNFKIKSADYDYGGGDIIIEPGKKDWGSGAQVQFNLATASARIYQSVSSVGFQYFYGNTDYAGILLERDSVKINAPILQLPTRYEQGHPMQYPPNGAIYYNAVDKKIWLGSNSNWVSIP